MILLFLMFVENKLFLGQEGNIKIQIGNCMVLKQIV